MERLKDKKVSLMLLIACFSAYLVTTAVKMSVPTVISSMVSEGFLNKSQSGLLAGLFYLVYGIGQLIFGKYFNSHRPYIGIKIALVGSAVCCVLMSLTASFYLLLLFWSLCAVANACFFPALMKIVSFTLESKHSAWASRFLSIAYHGGTILCLVAGSIIIKYIGWVKLYYFATVIAVLCFIYWLVAEVATKKALGETASAKHLPQNTAEAQALVKKPLREYIGSGIFCLFGVSFFTTLLNGVKSWSPTIIMETYGTSSSFSVLLNTVIVGTNIAFLLLMGWHVPRNKIRSMLLAFSVALPTIILLNFTDILNEYTYVVLLGVLTSVSAYASNVATVQTPFYFHKYNDVSRISGIANMCASFAMLLGNFGYGALADCFGWQIITILCTCFVAVNIILSCIAAPKFNKFIRK